MEPHVLDWGEKYTALGQKGKEMISPGLVAVVYLPLPVPATRWVIEVERVRRCTGTFLNVGY